MQIQRNLASTWSCGGWLPWLQERCSTLTSTYPEHIQKTGKGMLQNSSTQKRFSCFLIKFWISHTCITVLGIWIPAYMQERLFPSLCIHILQLHTVIVPSRIMFYSQAFQWLPYKKWDYDNSHNEPWNCLYICMMRYIVGPVYDRTKKIPYVCGMSRAYIQDISPCMRLECKELLHMFCSGDRTMRSSKCDSFYRWINNVYSRNI